MAGGHGQEVQRGQTGRNRLEERKCMMAKRLTEKQKAAKLAKYGQLRKGGKTAAAAAKAVGVAYMTRGRWEKGAGKPKKAGKKAGRMPGSRRVAAAVGAPARLTLTTPGGYRIEADSAEDVIAVLKALK